ncbi:MAG: chemotaxis protein CheV [Nitrospiraceae bacterium]|nr:MAG: chemotaxis protein CheV [Nitrospiraceae bacterium]
MEQAMKSNILLESGTNELEIVEFISGKNTYGINVAKVREIIRYPDAVIPVPDAHPSIEGIVDLRGKIVPIINLKKHLEGSGEIDTSSAYVIVSEFNMSMVGFCVNSVEGIQRLSWKQIEPPTGMISGDSGSVVSIVKLEDRMILLLDFEKITANISPETGMQEDRSAKVDKNVHGVDRASKTVYVVEDSNYIKKIIVNNLEKAGYNVRTASDGQAAWDYLNELLNRDDFHSIDDHLNIIISDIEMPQMDGMHLIKNIKNNEKLRHIPCIVFSSLISEEMSIKCKAVGADAQISKPEISQLVGLVDSFACP